MSKKVEHLKDILKKYDGELEMYLSPNTSEKLNTINVEDLAASATKWSNLFDKGRFLGYSNC